MGTGGDSAVAEGASPRPTGSGGVGRTAAHSDSRRARTDAGQAQDDHPSHCFRCRFVARNRTGLARAPLAAAPLRARSQRVATVFCPPAQSGRGGRHRPRFPTLPIGTGRAQCSWTWSRRYGAGGAIGSRRCAVLRFRGDGVSPRAGRVGSARIRLALQLGGRCWRAQTLQPLGCPGECGRRDVSRGIPSRAPLRRIHRARGPWCILGRHGDRRAHPVPSPRTLVAVKGFGHRPRRSPRAEID